MSQPNHHLYEFGPFRMDPVKRLLLRDGTLVPLPPKAFDTLLVLVQHSGELIKKDDLMRKVWPDIFVEENNLTQSVSLLRKILGETRQEHRYIVTVPGRGYRFVAEVTERSREEAELILHRSTSSQIVIREELEEESNDAETRRRGDTGIQGTERRVPVSPRLRVTASALVVLALVGVTVYWIAARNSHSQPNGMFAPGKVGQAFNFDRTDEFITVPSSPALSLNSSFTFEAWINPQTLSDGPFIFEKGANPLNRVGLQVFSTGVLCGVLNYNFIVCSSEGVVPVNQFTHVVFALEAATHQARLYANGALVATNTETRSPSGNTDDLIIGESAVNPGGHFRGLIDELSIYNRALSDGEIQAIFNAGSAGKCKTAARGPCAPPPAGLVAWYPGEGNANDIQGGDNGIAVLHHADVRERLQIAFKMIDEDGQGEEAIPILREVLQNDPNNAMAHWCLSEAYRYGGMLEESITEGERAIQLDPKVAENTTFNTYLYTGQYREFIASTQGRPNFPRTNFYRGLAYYYLKDRARAVAEFDRAFEMEPTLFHAQLGQAFKGAIQGHDADGIKVLQQLERANVQPDGELFYKVAQAYALLGDKQSALRVLRLSIKRNFFCYPYFIRDPFLQSLRHEPEYVQLIQQASTRNDEFKRKFF